MTLGGSTAPDAERGLSERGRGRDPTAASSGCSAYLCMYVRGHVEAKCVSIQTMKESSGGWMGGSVCGWVGG
jgi:hypothetical protein